MLVLPSELTQAQATACLAMLLQAVRSHEGPQVVADATALQRFDSSALAVLLACRRECLGDGKALVVKGLPVKLRELAGLYGVSGLLPALA
jgi:phospholipid transport system transporter-binding protein